MHDDTVLNTPTKRIQLLSTMPEDKSLLNAVYAPSLHVGDAAVLHYGGIIFCVDDAQGEPCVMPERSVFSACSLGSVMPTVAKVHLHGLTVTLTRCEEPAVVGGYLPLFITMHCPQTECIACLCIAHPHTVTASNGDITEVIAGVVAWHQDSHNEATQQAEKLALTLLGASQCAGLPPAGCALVCTGDGSHKIQFLEQVFGVLQQLGAGAFLPAHGVTQREVDAASCAASLCSIHSPAYAHVPTKEDVQHSITQYLQYGVSKNIGAPCRAQGVDDVLEHVGDSVVLHYSLQALAHGAVTKPMQYLRHMGDALMQVDTWVQRYGIPCTLALDIYLSKLVITRSRCHDMLLLCGNIADCLTARVQGEVNDPSVSCKGNGTSATYGCNRADAYADKKAPPIVNSCFGVHALCTSVTGMRQEADSLGIVDVPYQAYYGAQTQRSIENFAVSGLPMGANTVFIQSLAQVKRCAAIANMHIGMMPQAKGQAIAMAAYEVELGQGHEHFPVDWLQGGGGIAMNMNINEVVANRACEILGGARGDGTVNPNDDVNMCHSSNDVVLTAMHLTVWHWLKQLDVSLGRLEACFTEKSIQWNDIIKLGRTCLMDALPMTLGQQFSGYAAFVSRQRRALAGLHSACKELGMGATGIGTGIGIAPGFLPAFYDALGKACNTTFTPADNYFDVLQNTDFYLTVSGNIKAIATGISRIATDLRFMASGPRAGWGELVLPAVQPGSSIMPGKVNPLMPELMTQIGYQVCGNDLAITMAHEGGDIDLNVWEAIFLHNICQSAMLVHNGIHLFCGKCIEGITPHVDVCLAHAESSLALATIVSEVFGYKTGLAVATLAAKDGITIAQAAIALGLVDAESAKELLNPRVLTQRDEFLSVLNIYRQKYRKE